MKTPRRLHLRAHRRRLAHSRRSMDNTSSQQVHGEPCGEQCAHQDESTAHGTPGGATEASALAGAVPFGTEALPPAAKSASAAPSQLAHQHLSEASGGGCHGERVARNGAAGSCAAFRRHGGEVGFLLSRHAVPALCCDGSGAVASGVRRGPCRRTQLGSTLHMAQHQCWPGSGVDLDSLRCVSY